MSALTDFKATMRPGAVVDVTNHFITREDHECFGTTRRTITNANTSSWSYYEPAHDSDHAMKWPLARNIFRSEMGTFQIFGHPKDGDLFLTITPITRGE